MPTALIFLAEGAEEMETVVTADILVRGGVSVTIAGISSDKPVLCSRQVVIQPHKALADVSEETFDAVILPGGMGGARTLSTSEMVGRILKKHEESGKIVAAICAAPIALKAHKIGIGKKLTSYPAVETQLNDSYTYTHNRVEVDGKLVTSRGPGTAAEFALKLVELLESSEKALSLVEPMLLKI